jgi:hypothetical protein
MKKVIVKKQGEVVQIAKFESEMKATEWVEMLAITGAWGLSEHPELDEEGKETGIILSAEYVVEIEDITAEHELDLVIAARKAEYPSAEDFLNAFFDGGDEALEELRQKRLAVKSKYPKP